MPQMNKGGKFIFGQSIIRPDGRVKIPTQAAEEYQIASEGRGYLLTGSKVTGGFCVTRKGLLLPSKLGHILTETPLLLNYEAPMGAFIRYKGRSYCWTAISARNYADGGNAGVSGLIARYAAAVHPQQRYRLYHGRKGPAAG